MDHTTFFSGIVCSARCYDDRYSPTFSGKQTKGKNRKQNYPRRLYAKIGRGKQQIKSRQEIHKEHTDSSYGMGVGFTAGIRHE